MSNSAEKGKEWAKQEALANLGLYALEQNDLQSIMDRTIDISCLIMHLECAVIFSLDKEKESLHIGAQAGCAKESASISVDEESVDIIYALKQNDPTIVERYSEEQRFGISHFLEKENIESSIHLVVRGSDDHYGVLGFYVRQHRTFGQDEISFLKILASMIGMAIERDKKNKELKQKNKDLNDEMDRSRELQQEVLNNSLLQRWELGGYLHDNLAQILATAKINIHAIEKNLSNPPERVTNELQELREKIDSAATDVRDLTQDIIPIDIENEGFTYALNSLQEKAKAIHEINCGIKVEGSAPEKIDFKVATNLYFIIQEAIKNASTHGSADMITIIFQMDGATVKLNITDNGARDTPFSGENDGSGIQIMRHRMELLGGTFEINNRSDSEESGTQITCILPLDSLNKDGRDAVQW